MPTTLNDPVVLKLDGGCYLNLNLFVAAFDGRSGYWEKGGNGNTRWLDYVLYAGPPIRFNLKKMQEVILGFTVNMGATPLNPKAMKPNFSTTNQHLQANWQGMTLNIPINILPLPKHVGWY